MSGIDQKGCVFLKRLFYVKRECGKTDLQNDLNKSKKLETKKNKKTLTPIPSLGQAGPSQSGPGQTRPSQAGPGQTKPFLNDSIHRFFRHLFYVKREPESQPSRARPSQSRPSRARPIRAGPGQTRPSQAWPGQTMAEAGNRGQRFFNFLIFLICLNPFEGWFYHIPF